MDNELYYVCDENDMQYSEWYPRGLEELKATIGNLKENSELNDDEICVFKLVEIKIKTKRRTKTLKQVYWDVEIENERN